jgi:hypothetical protein
VTSASRHAGQGTQEALGLSERKVKDHADHERCFDRDVRVSALATGFATGWSSPGVEGVIGKPDGKVSSLLPAHLVLTPIPHPILRLRVLVLAAFLILHGRRLQIRGFTSMMHRDHEPCTNAPSLRELRENQLNPLYPLWHSGAAVILLHYHLYSTI